MICPVSSSMSNDPASAPSRVYVKGAAGKRRPHLGANVLAYRRVFSEAAGQRAVRNVGGDSVRPEPSGDQAPSPSAFVARTRTWYSVPGLNGGVAFWMTALVPVSLWGPFVQPVSTSDSDGHVPEGHSRYCRS